VGIILNGANVLLHRAERETFWSLPGGRVELLENARATIQREMLEELDVDAKVERLVWVVENFFEHDKKSYHEVAFFFLLRLPEMSSLLRTTDDIKGKEPGRRLIFRWFPIDQVERLPLYPTFLRTALWALPPTTEYLVHVDSSDDSKGNTQTFV
jgi:ADP-ribose pyrophosphatase YjhB (NUDIX family)